MGLWLSGLTFSLVLKEANATPSTAEGSRGWSDGGKFDLVGSI
jgi:hypothetical protein